MASSKGTDYEGLEMKPLKNIRIEYLTPVYFRVRADAYDGKNKRDWPMYIDKSISPEQDTFKEALRACMDILGRMWNESWRQIYWAYQHDIHKQVRKAVENATPTP